MSVMLLTDCQATGEDVPLIIRSCVRIINLYGEWLWIDGTRFDII